MDNGKMAERLKASDLKSEIAQAIEGSNPSLSANFELFRYAAPYYAQYVMIMRGYKVYMPQSHDPFDFLVDIDGKLHKIQLKTSTAPAPSGNYTFQLRRSRSNTSGHTFHYYTNDECDYFMLIDIKRNVWMIPFTELNGKGQVIPERDYSKYKW